MNIRPLQDRIVVKRTEARDSTASGLLIPDSAQEKPHEGTVVAVSRGKRREDGSLSPLDVNVGDHILIRQVYRQRDQAGGRGIPDRTRGRGARRSGRR